MYMYMCTCTCRDWRIYAADDAVSERGAVRILDSAPSPVLFASEDLFAMGRTQEGPAD